MTGTRALGDASTNDDSLEERQLSLSPPPMLDEEEMQARKPWRASSSILSIYLTGPSRALSRPSGTALRAALDLPPFAAFREAVAARPRSACAHGFLAGELAKATEARTGRGS